MSKSGMYALVGYKRQCYPDDSEETNVLALFTTEEKAEAYAEAARLKAASRYGLGRPFETFRKRSLLAAYTDVFIEPYEEEEYLIDPVL